jgi:hypothetical protein
MFFLHQILNNLEILLVGGIFNFIRNYSDLTFTIKLNHWQGVGLKKMIGLGLHKNLVGWFNGGGFYFFVSKNKLN